jgi:hypothetical protein
MSFQMSEAKAKLLPGNKRKNAKRKSYKSCVSNLKGWIFFYLRQAVKAIHYVRYQQ